MKEYKYYKTIEYNNFYEMLRALYEKHSKKIAIKYTKKTELVEITYHQLLKEISSLYLFYKKNSIANQNIGIISENRYEYITTYLSSVFLNVIAPIDKEITSVELKNLIDKFDIQVLFFTNKTKDTVLPAVCSDSHVKLVNIDESYQEIIQEEYPIPVFLEEVQVVERDKFSVLAFTSGTTGELKGVMLSQYNIMSNLRAAIENNPLKSPTLVVLPMNHTYGFNPGVLNTLYNAGTLCINMDLKHIARDLKLYNPYFVGVVPMMVEGIYNNIIREAKRKNKYEFLMRMIKISNFLLKFKIDVRRPLFGNILCKGLRLMVSGGASLNPIYIEKFEELGIKLLNGYGLTECSPLVAVNRSIHNVAGSVGTIIKDDDVLIAEDGEIFVKGPNVMLGYYKDEKATKESIQNGYFKTGDFGYKTGNVLFITGRKKNLIILENGKNFSPEVLEEKLTELSYIKECIVTTRKQKNSTIIIAKLYIDGDKTSLEADIKRINAEFPKYMQIDDYEIMEEEFEKNSTKKIIRSKYVK